MNFLNTMFSKTKNALNSSKAKQPLYQQLPQKSKIPELPINEINPNYTKLSRVTGKNIKEISKKKTLLKVTCWNAEDFVSINGLYKSEKMENNLNKQTIDDRQKPENRELYFLNELRVQDIIMIQEWKNINFEGDLFMCKLNKRRVKYSVTSVDRVAVIYNTDIFDKSKTITYEIPLAYEAPKLIEKIYTKGRQKYNMLTILFPNDQTKLPVCVVNFHLSAYSPQMHQDVHKKQLTKLIEDSLQQIKQRGLTNYGFIIGGDTNYRTLGENSDDLLNALITNNYNLPCGTGEGQCGNGILKDVCTEKTCLHTKTQSFKCVHETGVAKKGIKYVSGFYSANSNPTSSFQDNRLDFLATNLLIDYNYTKILKLCDLSDHSAILSKMNWKIDSTKQFNTNVLLEGQGQGQELQDMTGKPRNYLDGGKNKTKRNKTKRNKNNIKRNRKTIKGNRKNKTSKKL